MDEEASSYGQSLSGKGTGVTEYPKYGTSQITCGKRKCGWTGTELELSGVPHKKMPGVTQNVCPKCGNDNYVFVEPTKEEKS